MSAADESVAHSDIAPVQNPAAICLERLHPSGRRSLRRVLDRAVAIFTDGAVTDATAFDWSQIDLQQVEELRSALVDRSAAAGTVNHMQSGVRSKARTAWAHGLVDDRTRSKSRTYGTRSRNGVGAGRYVKRNEGRGLFAAVLGTDPIRA